MKNMEKYIDEANTGSRYWGLFASDIVKILFSPETGRSANINRNGKISDLLVSPGEW